MGFTGYNYSIEKENTDKICIFRIELIDDFDTPAFVITVALSESRRNEVVREVFQGAKLP